MWYHQHILVYRHWSKGKKFLEIKDVSATAKTPFKKYFTQCKTMHENYHRLWKKIFYWIHRYTGIVPLKYKLYSIDT